jgi:hypothetical protein
MTIPVTSGKPPDPVREAAHQPEQEAARTVPDGAARLLALTPIVKD